MPAKRNLPPGVYTSGLHHFQYRVSLPKDPATGKRPQIVRGGFTSAEDAYLAKIAFERSQGKADALRAVLPGELTVGAYIERFVREHDCDESTRANYRWRSGHVIAGLGHLRLTALKPADVQDWVDALARSVSPSTARDARALLVLALNRLVRLDQLPRNVASLSVAPRHAYKKPTILSGQEIQRFLAAADSDRYAALWYLGLFCQLRPGELAGLRWSDVDLTRGHLWIRNTRTRDADGRWVLGDGAKTAASVRDFPLPAACVRVLREHRREQAAHRVAAPIGFYEDNDFVFPGRRGRILDNSVMETALKRVCERAGVPSITPHGLRHSGATWARTRGVAPEVVQRRLGHKDVAFTLNVYSQPVAGDQQRASDELDAALDELQRGA